MALAFPNHSLDVQKQHTAARWLNASVQRAVFQVRPDGQSGEIWRDQVCYEWLWDTIQNEHMKTTVINILINQTWQT